MEGAGFELVICGNWCFFIFPPGFVLPGISHATALSQFPLLLPATKQTEWHRPGQPRWLTYTNNQRLLNSAQEKSKILKKQREWTNAHAKAWALLYSAFRASTPSCACRQMSHADFFYTAPEGQRGINQDFSLSWTFWTFWSFWPSIISWRLQVEFNF